MKVDIKKWYAIQIDTKKLTVSKFWKFWGNDIFINKVPIVKTYFIASVIINILLILILNK